MKKNQTFSVLVLLNYFCLSSQVISADELQSHADSIIEAESDVSRTINIDEPCLVQTQEVENKKMIYESAIDFADWIDRFFGEEEELESASYDFLRLVNVLGWREGEGGNFRPRIKAKVNLPKIDKKFSLMFANSNETTSNEFEVDQNADVFQKNKDEKKASAAINYESNVYNNSKFDTRVGIDSSFDSFVLFKHSYQIYKSDTLLFRNFNYLFWKEKELFGFNPRLELDKVLSKTRLFRWKYSILRSEKSEGNEWKNTFSLVKRYSDERWLSYDLDIIGASEHQADVETYRFALRYRWQLDTKWLYFEIEPEFLWQRTPEDSERKLIPGILLRLEIQFEE